MKKLPWFYIILLGGVGLVLFLIYDKNKRAAMTKPKDKNATTTANNTTTGAAPGTGTGAGSGTSAGGGSVTFDRNKRLQKGATGREVEIMQNFLNTYDNEGSWLDLSFLANSDEPDDVVIDGVFGNATKDKLDYFMEYSAGITDYNNYKTNGFITLAVLEKYDYLNQI